MLKGSRPHTGKGRFLSWSPKNKLKFGGHTSSASTVESEEQEDPFAAAAAPVPEPRASESSPLLRSLALLDASVESLDFLPATTAPEDAPAVPVIMVHAKDAEDADRSVEIGRGTREAKTASLSAFQLPETTGRPDSLFGADMLWDALGLNREDEFTELISLDHREEPRLVETPSINSSTSASSQLSSLGAPSRPSSTTSTFEEIAEDIFNMSEFPPEFPSFSSSDAAPDSPVVTTNRSSHLLNFPSPPCSTPPTFLPPSPPPSWPPRTTSLFAGADFARAVSPAFELFVHETKTEEDDHDVAHERLTSMVLANLGLGHDDRLAGLGLLPVGNPRDSPTSSRASSAMGHVPFAFDDLTSPSLLAYTAESSDGGHEPVGTALTTTTPFPLSVKQRSRASSLAVPGVSTTPLPPFDVPTPALFPHQTNFLVEGVAASVAPLRTQRSLPAIFCRESAMVDPSVFNSDDYGLNFNDAPLATPRARAMALGSPLTLTTAFFATPAPSDSDHLEPGTPDGGDRSPSVVSFESSYRDHPFTSSGSASPKTPKTPTELYGASLGQLRMHDETEFPMWDVPSELPSSRSASPTAEPRTPVPPSPSPLSAPPTTTPRAPPTLRPSPSSKSIKEERKAPTRRLSFASLRRRKSEVSMSSATAPPPEDVPPTPTLPLPPPLVPLTPTTPSSPFSPDGTSKMKRKSRLSLFIPRFGKEPVVTPSLPSASSTQSEFSSSSASTPSLLAPSSGFSMSSATFPSTPPPLPDSPGSGYFGRRVKPDYFSHVKPDELPEDRGRLADSAYPGPIEGTLLPRTKPSLSLGQFLLLSPKTSSVFTPSPAADDHSHRPPFPSPQANDIIVFPVILGAPAGGFLAASGTSSLANTVSSITRDDTDKASVRTHATHQSEMDDTDSGEDEYGEAEEDDVPLGTIPGALKMQKSLRQSVRKARSAAPNESSTTRPQRRAPKPSDPFEFDAKLASVASASVVASPSSSTPTGGRSRAPSIAKPQPPVPSRPRPPPPKELEGHSLLPHTDDAVDRRSAGVPRSPSLPLAPHIAQSTLTIDLPAARPPHPVKENTFDVLPSTRKMRPNLSVNVGSNRIVHEEAPRPPRSPSPHTPRSPHSPSALSPTRPPHPHLPPSLTRGLSYLAAAPAMQRQTSGSSGSTVGHKMARSASASTEHKIFIVNHTSYIHFTSSATTRCGEVVATAKAKGALVGGSDVEGGWALFEVCRALGLERPCREYELLDDVVKSWDSPTNVLVLRRTPLWPVLSAHLRPQPQGPRSDWVQFEVKPGKWSKRFLTLKDGVITYSKSDKGKDPVAVCQLAAFDVFVGTPALVGQIKAPKPCVFALKSLLPRAHYEKEEDYCYFVSVKTAEELHGWVKAITEARNVFVRQREASVLAANPSPSQLLAATPPTSAPSPLIPRSTAPRSIPSRPPPPSLSLPTPVPLALKPSSSTNGVLTARPSAQAWQAMSSDERTKWLKHAEHDARTKGASFLGGAFGGEEDGSGAVGGLARAKSSRR